jgi:hypothetical protein
LVIKAPLSDDPKTIHYFEEEIQALKGLDHPGIVKALGASEGLFQFVDQPPSKRPWFAMEFIPGQTLRQRLQGGARLSWAEVRKLLGDLTQTLEYLHERKLCHRDIKPDNLIFNSKKNRWVLVDFGIAKSLRDDLRITVTQSAQGPGSWDYMSPEQLSAQPVDCRTDIYSLGKTAWEALIGETPRVGTPFPSALLGEKVVPREVDVLLEKMVAHKPASRYANPADLKRALKTGALTIERRKQWTKVLRRVLRATSIVVVVGVLAILSWFGGDFWAKQQAMQLYVDHQESPTRALRQLERFAGDHAFWGRSYTDAKIEELGPAAAKERQQMLAEYAEVLKDLGDAVVSLEFRTQRARNFLAKYRDIFDDTAQFRDLDQRKADLEQSLLVQQETRAAEALIQRIEDLEKQGSIKGALEQSDHGLKQLTTPGPRQLIEKRRTEIVDKYVNAKLREIDQNADTTSPQGLLNAALAIEELEKTVGATVGTANRLKNFDSKLWQLCNSKAAAARANAQFQLALDQLQDYERHSRTKQFTGEKIAEENKTRDAYDDHEWMIASGSADNNVGQKTFTLAVKDLKNYVEKWRNGRHRAEANQRVTNLVLQHRDYVRSMVDKQANPDLDLVNEEVRRFIDAYGAHSPQATSDLRKYVCLAAHSRIIRVYSDADLAAAAKKDRLFALDFKQSEPHHIVYLRDLVGRAGAALDAPANNLRFWHAWERPPKDAFNMSDAPSHYLVTIKSIHVELSNQHFDALKGANNADPRVDVEFGDAKGMSRSPPVYHAKILGPVNTRSFTIFTISPAAFYLNTKQESLRFTIADDDGFAPAAPWTVYYKGTEFNRSQIDQWFRGGNGTTITLSWTVD